VSLRDPCWTVYGDAVKARLRDAAALASEERRRNVGEQVHVREGREFSLEEAQVKVVQRRGLHVCATCDATDPSVVLSVL